MRRILLSGLALTLGAMSALAADTIVFGAAISITGKTAKEGGYTRDGYQIAIDKINEMGGIKVGGKTYKLELKYYDDETKPERTAQLIEKLINEDKVNLILGPYGSSPTGTAAPLAERYKIPMVEANGSAEAIFSKGYKYTFMILSPAKLYLRGIIDAVRAKDPSAKTVANLGKSADYIFGATQWTEALKYNGEDPWKTPKAFGDAFRAKHPDYKVIPYQVAESAVAVIAYQKAIEKAGTIQPTKVRDALAAIDMMTFYGKIKFDARGVNIYKPMAAEQYQPDGNKYTVWPQDVAEKAILYPMPAWDKR